MINSKIRYALPLVGSVWGIEGYVPQEPKKTCFTKHDLLQLQSCQRKAALLINPDTKTMEITPTHSILSDLGWLSINQLIAYTTVVLLLKIMKNQLPSKTFGLFNIVNNYRIIRGKSNKLTVDFIRLNISKEGFVHQATMLFNLIPDIIIEETSIKRQKILITEWVRGNVIFKP